MTRKKINLYLFFFIFDCSHLWKKYLLSSYEKSKYLFSEILLEGTQREKITSANYSNSMPSERENKFREK